MQSIQQCFSQLGNFYSNCNSFDGIGKGFYLNMYVAGALLVLDNLLPP